MTNIRTLAGAVDAALDSLEAAISAYVTEGVRLHRERGSNGRPSHENPTHSCVDALARHAIETRIEPVLHSPPLPPSEPMKLADQYKE